MGHFESCAALSAEAIRRGPAIASSAQPMEGVFRTVHFSSMAAFVEAIAQMQSNPLPALASLRRGSFLARVQIQYAGGRSIDLRLFL
jgi:hypothetical protein